MGETNQNFDKDPKTILNIDTAPCWDEVGVAETVNEVAKAVWSSGISTNATEVEIAYGYRTVMLQCEGEIQYSFRLASGGEITKVKSLHLNTGATGVMEIKIPKGLLANDRTVSVYLIMVGVSGIVPYRLVKG